MEDNKRSRKSGLIAALVGVAALGLTAATAFGVTSFSAEVGGTGSFQSGTLLLSKSINGGTPCLSSSNAAGAINTNINDACSGSDLGTGTTNVPGSAQTATVVLTNEGSVTSGALTMTLGSCTAVPAPFSGSAHNPLSSGADVTGFCGKVDVTIQNGANCILPAGTGACPTPSNANTLASLSATPVTLANSLAPGASATLTVNTVLDDSNATGATNADQGLAASVPITYDLAQ